jgi:hypothetical protein
MHRLRARVNWDPQLGSQYGFSAAEQFVGVLAWTGTMEGSGTRPAISRIIWVLIASENWAHSRTEIVNAPGLRIAGLV